MIDLCIFFMLAAIAAIFCTLLIISIQLSNLVDLAKIMLYEGDEIPQVSVLPCMRHTSNN